MKLATIDLTAKDVPSATAFFRDVVGLEVREVEVYERFAELGAETITLMPSPDAMVPVKPAKGVILHFEAEDVSKPAARAKEHGATILMAPCNTDWGWESRLITGPEGIIVDCYRPLDR